MLDRHLHPRIKPLLHQCVRVLDKPGITPDGLTLVGFAIGVLALPFLALGWYLAARKAINASNNGMSAGASGYCSASSGEHQTSA